MRLKIDIDSDNDAMQHREQAIDALRDIVRKLRLGIDSGRILDLNGNTVGAFSLTESAEDGE